MTTHFIPSQAGEVIGIDLKQTNEQDNYQRLLAESSPWRGQWKRANRSKKCKAYLIAGGDTLQPLDLDYEKDEM